MPTGTGRIFRVDACLRRFWHGSPLGSADASRRAQLTAALTEPVQDRLATLLAAQDDFLKKVQRNAAEQEAKHQEQMAALSRKHQEQMAELFRRVSAPTPLSWGQPAGLLRFGEENAAQCASDAAL